MNHTKIAIIGAGAVGSTIAYALLLKNVTAEIILIDANEMRCRGEILDLSDAIALSETISITEGSFKDARNANIIVITAGKRQEPGQDRIALLEQNKKIITSIINSLKPINPNTIIIMVTNPVDIMTLIAQQHAKIPVSHIFGSGTFLDTQRLRSELSKRLAIASPSIHAYILGEHGDTQFPAWSSAYIGGTPLSSFKLPMQKLNEIAKHTKDKAYEIIACKGSTYYGIATCVATLCHIIVSDQKRIIPVSCYIQKYKVCLSMPAVLGKNGIEKIIEVPLNGHEKKQLMHSIATLKNYIR